MAKKQTKSKNAGSPRKAEKTAKTQRAKARDPRLPAAGTTRPPDERSESAPVAGSPRRSSAADRRGERLWRIAGDSVSG